MPVDALVVSGPDGQPVAPQNVAKGKHAQQLRSRAAPAGHVSHRGRRRHGDGALGRRRQAEALARHARRKWRPAFPPNAAKLEVEQMQRRVETFVSVGHADAKLKAQRARASSSCRSRIPTISTRAKRRSSVSCSTASRRRISTVEIIAGGTRYRDAPDEMHFKTDAEWRGRRHLAGGRAVLAGCVGRGRGRHGAGREEAPRRLQRHLRSADAVVCCAPLLVAAAPRAGRLRHAAAAARDAAARARPWAAPGR